MFEALKNKGYEIEFVSHSSAILEIDFPDAAAELEQAMLNQSVPIEEIIRSGGGETKGTQRLRNGLTAKGWVQETFTIKKTINDEPRESISHKVDHVRIFDRSNGKRYRLALEIEWNNKDPFFDRDLENFKRLHAEGGRVVITRGTSLQDSLPSFVRRWVDENRIDSFDRLSELGIAQTARQKREVITRRTSPQTHSVSRGMGGSVCFGQIRRCHNPLAQTGRSNQKRCRQSVPACIDRSTCVHRDIR